MSEGRSSCFKDLCVMVISIGLAFEFMFRAGVFGRDERLLSWVFESVFMFRADV